jgi:uncharacterized protein (UPF0264 family)
MTGMLASVNSLEETRQALAAHVDIIDLKQPALGALGALDRAVVKNIVALVNRRRPVSATVGDLPMQPELVFDAVKMMAATGVDYIKIGFFPNGDSLATIQKLAELTADHALIAVLFADAQPDFSVLSALKNAGFKGVMLDTMDKKRGSLTRLMSAEALGGFVRQARTRQLLCGLAGSLRLEDIGGLLAHQPDYLGFRGALCHAHNRTRELDADAMAAIRQTITAG